MYPFSTDRKEYYLKSSEQEILTFLHKNINSNKIGLLKSSNLFYGKVIKNEANFELGQFPIRNAFRPVVKLKWSLKDGETKLISTYALSKIVFLIPLFIILSGLYISLQNKMIIPFLLTSILSLMLVFGIFRLMYFYSKKKTTELLEELLINLK